MAVHPFHRIGRREGQNAREHLVQRDAEGVEIAAGVDRAVHPPGLFGCHVGERTGDGLGRLGRLPLAGQARCDAKPGEPHVSIRAVHHDISWLDVFVDEPALMKLAQSRGNSDSQAQEASYLHGPTEQTVERLAARIIEHQHGPTGVAHEGQRPRRPCPVELIFQLVFVREAIES